MSSSTMQPWEILDKFTGHLRESLARAIAVATETDSGYVEPLHLLYSLSLQNGSVAHEILSKVNITTEKIQSYFTSAPRNGIKHGIMAGAPTATMPELSPLAKQALEKAMLLAHEYEHAHVGTEHLLSGLLEVKDQKIKTLLADTHTAQKKISNQLTTILESTSKFPELAGGDDADMELHDLPAETHAHETADAKKSSPEKSKRPRTALEYFARELTDPENQKTIDPVIGRDEEISRVIHILSRRTKNNPVLLGDPGVGKTAIVEGLAKKIMTQDV